MKKQTSQLKTRADVLQESYRKTERSKLRPNAFFRVDYLDYLEKQIVLKKTVLNRIIKRVAKLTKKYWT